MHKFEIKDISIDPIPKIGFLQRKKFRVELGLDQLSKRFKTKSSKRCKWTNEFHFDAADDSTLKLRLYVGRQYIGEMEEKIATLVLKGSHRSGVSAPLVLANPSSKNPSSIVTFEFTSLVTDVNAQERELSQAIHAANVSVERMNATHSSNSVAEGVNDTAEQMTTMLDVLGPLIDKVELLTEIHPYAKAASTALLAIPKALLAQKERDDTVIGLIKTMNKMYDFVHRAKPLEKTKAHKDLLAKMIDQTTECAYFIRAYAEDERFITRTLKNLASDVDKQITDLTEKLAEVSLDFAHDVVRETGISVEHIKVVTMDIETSVARIIIENKLRDMPYADGARYNSSKLCLPDTRVTVIDQIVSWVNGTDDRRVFWLTGVAGSGKSSIANSVAHFFETRGRLGSSFVFVADAQSSSRVKHLFRTVSRDIADRYPSWKEALYASIKDLSSDLLTTNSATEQFKHFLLEPSKKLTISGPIVIIIDALDESGDKYSRRELVSILSQNISTLPRQFRIFVTSRPEPDIHTAFYQKPGIVFEYMDGIAETRHDITIFIREQLSGVLSPAALKNTNSWLERLVVKSDNLFQWASTACRFINDGEGHPPEERLAEVLSTSASDNHLDSLYLTVLHGAIKTDKILLTRFRRLLGTILLARRPLGLNTLYELCSDLEGCTLAAVKAILKPLGTLLSGVGQDFPLRPLHASLKDFLIDPQRSGEFFVDLSEQQKAFALSCLRIMNDNLQFNICRLETSYLLNEEVLDLPSRIAKYIPPHLSYACLFFVHHIRDSPSHDNDIMQEIRELMYNRFLYWLEALSLIQQLNSIEGTLYAIYRWMLIDKDISLFIDDATKFVRRFKEPILQSAPHIYLSALPFERKESLISKTFLHLFPNTLCIQAKSRTYDISELLAYSPDGNCVARGSIDAKNPNILIRNVKTGQVVAGPLPGHKDTVEILVYAPNGSYICSGSDDGNVRLWAIATPDVSPTVFRGHTKPVTSISFSPDSRHIASGSRDGTIRLWDIGNPDNPPQTFDYHTQTYDNTRLYDPLAISVVFSPDKTQIRSGLSSYSSGIFMCIWDLNSGTQTTTQISETSDPYGRITVSPNGRYFAATKNEEDSVLIWDTEKQNNQFSLPIPHRQFYISSLAFSSTGKHFALGSTGGKISFWDVEARICIGQFRRHGSYVGCMAFSPDGTHIVSGSKDETIHVSDISNMRVNQGVVKRLFWMIGVPNFSWDGFWWTEDANYIESSIRYTIDCTRFVHGPRWTECMITE